MKKMVLLVFVSLAIIMLIIIGRQYFIMSPQTDLANKEKSGTLDATTMKITSPFIKDQEPMSSKYTCDGANINPPLQINDVPAGTQSIALIVDDPDASGGDWVHWVVFDISPSTHFIDQDSVPATAIEGTNSFGKQGYGGPCPPPGSAHRYFFKVYALDDKLNLPGTATKEEVEAKMQGHILQQAQLIGTYQKQ